MQSLHRVSASDLQIFLETPEELLRESEEIQIAVASFSETPRSLLEILVNSDYSAVLEAARLHVNLAGTLRDYQVIIAEVLRNLDLGQNDRLAVELMQFAPVAPCFLSEWVPERRLIEGLQNEYMPLRYRLQLLERLSQSDKLEARLVVAESLETPVSLLELLAGDLELAVRLTVESNDNFPSEVVELVKSQHDLASDWDADVEQLRELGESRWSWIRLTVAQNPFAAEDVLMKLARDEEFRIRLAVAKNPNVSAEILAVLVEDSGKEIQSVVVKHPNTGEETLHKLFADYKDEIEIRENLPASILEQFYREKAIDDKPLWKNWGLTYFFREQVNTPTWILAELINIDLEVLYVEKSKKSTTGYYPFFLTKEEIYEELVWNEVSFLKKIAKHPQVSESILEKIAKYRNPYVKLAVAQSQQTSNELKLILLEELSIYPNEEVKRKIAEDINTPEHILERLGKQQSYQQKLLQQIRRVLTSDYAAGECTSAAHTAISNFKNELLNPAGIHIDVERYMEVIETPEILEQIMNSLSRREFDDEDYEDNKINWFLKRWLEVFPEISKNLAKKIVNQVLKILGMIVDDVKSPKFSNKITLELIGNPSTPVNLRESLKNQLLIDNVENNVIYRLAYNTRVPYKQRIEYFQQIISEEPNYFDSMGISGNSFTPADILKQLWEKRDNKHRRRIVEGVASNPATPEHILRSIADERNELLWWILAKNPSTPIDLLYRFLNEKVESKISSSETIFDVIVSNTGLSTLQRYRFQVEHDNAQIATKAHELFAQRTNNFDSLAEVVETGYIRKKFAIARDSKTPVEILKRLTKDENVHVCAAVLENPSFPSSCLMELAQNSNSSVQTYIARRTLPIPRDVIEWLLENGDVGIRSDIANNRNTPLDILLTLAEDKESKVRINALTNPNIPAEVVSEALLNVEFEKREIEAILRRQGETMRNSPVLSGALERLSHYPNDSIRYLVASYPSASSQTLERLAFDEYKSVQENLAKNPSTPANVLIELAKRDQVTSYISEYDSVSNQIAMREDAPPEALEYIVRQPELAVVYQALLNPNTPTSALKWLAENHNHQSILYAVVEHPNITHDILTGLSVHESAKLREVVASQQKCPLSILETLACDSAVKVQQQVAANPKTPHYILESFSQSENSAIRTRVASNPNLSIIILKRLANDEKVEVRREVAKNPNTPQNIRESLQNLLLQPQTQEINPTLISLPRIYNPKTDDLSILLTEYAQSNNAFVRFTTLLHPLTPEEILNQAANSASWLERYAVAENESTPLQIRQILAGDGNRIVRAAANNNL